MNKLKTSSKLTEQSEIKAQLLKTRRFDYKIFISAFIRVVFLFNIYDDNDNNIIVITDIDRST